MSSDSSPQENDAPDAGLTVRECWELLRDEAYGRIAVIGDDGPEIYPINAVVDHGTVVFRTASGAKLAALRADPRVAFEVDGHDADSAWSVMIRGRARLVTSLYEGIDVVGLGVTPWQHGPKPEYVRIEPDVVSGRRFDRAAADDSDPIQRTTAVD